MEGLKALKIPAEKGISEVNYNYKNLDGPSRAGVFGHQSLLMGVKLDFYLSKSSNSLGLSSGGKYS